MRFWLRLQLYIAIWYTLFYQKFRSEIVFLIDTKVPGKDPHPFKSPSKGRKAFSHPQAIWNWTKLNPKFRQNPSPKDLSTGLLSPEDLSKTSQILPNLSKPPLGMTHYQASIPTPSNQNQKFAKFCQNFTKFHEISQNLKLFKSSKSPSRFPVKSPIQAWDPENPSWALSSL